MTKEYDYDIALSFAGEERHYVDKVANILKKSNISVFYDDFETASIWGKNLYKHLKDIYNEKARYTIIFCSKNYANKVWTLHEMKAAQERAVKENSEYILPARFDNTTIPGLTDDIAYIDLSNYTPYELCKIISIKINKEIVHKDLLKGNLSGNKISILVVDDEELARERIKKLLKDNPKYKICAEAENGAEAIMMFERYNPDIVLTDISMPVMSGIEVAKHLSMLDTPPAIIFTTAYGEYALEAFSTKSSGYLMKPIRHEQLIEVLTNSHSLNKAQRHDHLDMALKDSEPPKYVLGKINGEIILVPVEDIHYFHSDNENTIVKHKGGETPINMSLRDIESEIPDTFIRIHRNALVAKKLITGLSKGSYGGISVSLDKTEETFEVSRRHVAELRRLIRDSDYS